VTGFFFLDVLFCRKEESRSGNIPVILI